MFVISYRVCPWQASPASLMFVGKTGGYLIAPLKGRLLALSTNNLLGWKGLPRTNTLAYYESS